MAPAEHQPSPGETPAPDDPAGASERGPAARGPGTPAFPLPANEAGRLRALAAYDPEGARPEVELGRIVRLAADLLGVPIATVSLVGHDRQFFQARIGLEPSGTPRNVSFCAHAIMAGDVLVVPDATRDPRFSENPLVTGEMGLRFYAGAPLMSPLDNHRVGTLCVMDRAPRPALDARQKELLVGLAALVMDRMELRRLEAARHAAVARFEHMARAAPGAVICADAEGQVTYWNGAAEALFGWSAAEMLGGPLDAIVPARLRAAHKAGLARRAASEAEHYAGFTVEVPGLRRDGGEFPAEFTLSCWREDGRPCFGANIRDITDRKGTEARLQHLAHHDTLTGLANRRVLAEEAERAAAEGGEAALVLLDLDGFKHVNDTLGHDAGDAMLREVAGRLSRQLGARGTLARLGGDEFAAVLPGLDAAAAMAATRSLQSVLAAPFRLGARSFPVGASAGVAVTPEPGGEAAGSGSTLLANADLALYRAKAAGGGACRLFQPGMRAEYAARRQIEDEVQGALGNGEFVLHYQPQVRLSDGTLVGAEALLRWNHPTRGLLPPGQFLGALEAGPAAGAVGDWAIDEACRQASSWREAGVALRMGVNLFAEQLRAGGLARTVGDALARWNLPPHALELELTETIALQHDGAMLAMLRELHGGGVGLSFDDFGTGYASLSTLKRFPLSRLKIDRSFVSDLETDTDDAAIVEAVLALARALGLEVVAEGIETVTQHAFLLTRGCDEGQGYLYSRAVPAESFPGAALRSRPERPRARRDGRAAPAPGGLTARR